MRALLPIVLTVGSALVAQQSITTGPAVGSTVPLFEAVDQNLNEAALKNTPFYGIPHPGTYIVDPKGVVKAKYFEDDYRERDTASDIPIRQFGFQPGLAHTTIETKDLKLSLSASAAVVHSGQHIALTLDVELRSKMHVYAPGVQGYIPIDWSMTRQPRSLYGRINTDSK